MLFIYKKVKILEIRYNKIIKYAWMIFQNMRYVGYQVGLIVQ